MNMKKKSKKKQKFALVTILMVILVLTGCGLPFEIKMKDSGESSTAESQNSTENTNSSVAKPANPSTGEAKYEPVTIDCSEILNSGTTSYFEITYQYGDACTVIQRYIYENQSYNGGLLKIEPGTETDLATIIDNVNVLEGGAPSAFTEVIDGWTMSLEATEEEKSFMNYQSMEDMRELCWCMTLMSQGYSQEEAEAIVGVASEPTLPYISMGDDLSNSAQGDITLDDVSYVLFGDNNTMILFGGYYADKFTIEEKFSFDSSGNFKSLETTLTTGSISDTDEIFEILESLYDGFDSDDYTLTKQSDTKYTMSDSVPTRSFFFENDLASMSGVTYSVVYSVLQEAL